jgi:hypothetical protein
MTKQPDFLAIIMALYFEQTVPQLSPQQWQHLLTILRDIDLLASCYFRLKHRDKLSQLPEFLVKHMRSAAIYSERQAQQVIYECGQIQHTLNQANIPVYFLKGASYTLAQYRQAKGRIYSDIDALVAKEHLEQAETLLNQQGWKTKKLNDYDDKYYRQWAHEIPPMQHIHRGTVLDLHHNIMLPISRYSIDINTLLCPSQTVTIAEQTFQVLRPESALLHSMIHMIHNEEFHHAFRDLLDCALLLEQYGEPLWWKLYHLADTLGFLDELYLIVSVSQCFCPSLYPFSTQADFNQQRRHQCLNWQIKHIYALAMQPQSYLTQSARHRRAQLMAFSLGHLRKMPLSVLIPHSFAKLKRAVGELIFGKYYFDK